MKMRFNHSLKSHIISFITLCCVALPVRSQSSMSPEVDSLARFVQNIVKFNNMFIQEKVYLHFDNTGYFMGETIWFKAYVVNPMSNRPNILSRVLYAELLTPEGRVLQKLKLKIENGQCNGQFSLKELLHPGYYEVRAYTALMLNWPDAPVYSRVFPIFNAPQEKGKNMYKDPVMNRVSNTERLPEMRAKRPKTEKINVQFFPEGGNLAMGLENRVYFKITDKRNNPLDFKGNIVNSRKEQITTVNTSHQGMGVFTLTPVEGESYYLQGDTEEKMYPLPAAQPLGVSMAVNNLQDEDLSICLMRHPQHAPTKALGLTTMCRGRIIRFDQIHWEADNTATITLKKADLPEGVNQFTLFDTEGRVYADRLTFIPIRQQVNFSITNKKQEYRPKEKVEMSFKLTNNQGDPVYTMFSLSVRDAEAETPKNHANGGSLAANLLLGSELKGYIHDIDYYFQADDAPHRQALDLLLGTQGWRRYNWEQMTHPQDFRVEYPAEEGILIRGDLTSTFRNRKKDDVEIKVYLYNGAGHTRTGSCITDSVGGFAFLSEDFNGRWIMNIHTKENDKLKEMNVNLKKTPSPQGRFIEDKEKELFVQDNDNLIPTTVKDSITLYDERGKLRWENLLPTVEIEDEREWQSGFVRKWNNLIYDMEYERINMDDTGENYLKFFYEWLEDTNPYFTYSNDTSSITARYKGRPVRFFVTRIGTNSSRQLVEQNVSIDVSTLTINDVEAITIADKPNASQAMIHLGLDTLVSDNSVIISVFVRNDYFRHKEYKGTRRTKVQGFTPALEFYMPDYSYADLPQEEDFRRTLFWAPYVATNKQGEATVSFYNSKHCKYMRVNAETITFGGIMGSFEE